MLLTKVLRQLVAIAQPIVKKLETAGESLDQTHDRQSGRGNGSRFGEEQGATGHGECLAAPAGDRTETTSGPSPTNSERSQSAGGAGQSRAGLEERLADREA